MTDQIKAESAPSDAEVLELMRILAPLVEHRRHYGLRIEDAEVYAREVLGAGYRRSSPGPTCPHYGHTDLSRCPICSGVDS